jgi:SAM-dependent methyltransferase
MTQHSLQAYYNDPEVLRHYKDYGKLEAAEAVLLSRVKDELKDQPILDIGMGGGRTTPYLRQISNSYIGIDFSEGMIRSARQKFSDANLLVRDAKDLSIFHDGQFAAVFFLGAGLDDVSAKDRLRILKEIHRVLRSRGIFILAGHNLEAHDMRLCLENKLRLSGRPRILISDNLLRLRSYISHFGRKVWNIIHDKSYVIYMDYDECFADSPKPGILLPTYYMRSDAQIKQLSENGFCQAEAIDEKGKTVEKDRVTKGLFLHYIARKLEI